MRALTAHQREEFEQEGILQLAEGIEFILRLTNAIHQSLRDDSRVSIPEVFSVAWSCFGTAKQAFSGITDIADEAKNLSARHIHMLADAFYDDVPASADTDVAEWRNRMVERAIGALIQLVHVWQGYRDRENWFNPPKAKVVPE